MKEKIMRITIEQLQANLPAVLDRARNGELVEILVDGKYALELTLSRRAAAVASAAPRRKKSLLRRLLLTGGI
jgi:antitoxin (DNA-binding transcriptional repressor) of toxin-antitoxin stability system